MKKLVFLFGVVIFAFFAVSLDANAAGFNIKTIGGVSLGGDNISKFWHTSLSPTINGDCIDGSISIDIDGIADTTACTNNIWTYKMPVQTDGTHQVSFTNGDTTIAMALTLGSNAAEYSGSTGSGEVLPETGVWETTLLLIGGAVVALIAGRKLWSTAK